MGLSGYSHQTDRCYIILSEEVIFMDRFKSDNEVFTTDADWKDVFYDEDEAYKTADEIGGEVCLCYYFNEPIPHPSSCDGEFLGFLIRKDGVLLGEDEI